MRVFAITLLALASAASAPNFGRAGQQQSSVAQTPQKNGQAAARLLLAPQFVPGQVVRYQMETTTTSESHRGGDVRDPQAPGKLTIVWNAITRMEVLSAGKDAQGHPDGTVRIRSTYEKSTATASSDGFDPTAYQMETQYKSLEGASFEFTLDAAGHLSDVTGIDALQAQGQTADSMRAWLGQFTTMGNMPTGGIVVGQSWTSDQPVASAPLAGLTWHTRSTYLRDEPCQPENKAGADNPMAGETCAVILTKLSLLGSKPGHDATPDSYRKQGLRTEGTWSGEGDSLSYIALSNGHLVSVTQSSSEKMDFSVISGEGDHRVNYQGAVESHSQLALLPSQKQ
jgi:hypothetical protein